MALASGANLVTAGLLDSTLMLSYEHLVMVDEMMNQLKSAQSPDMGCLDDDILAISQEGRPGTRFICSEHTREHMKQSVYYSNYTGRVPSSYENWYSNAHEKVKNILMRKDERLNRMIDERFRAVEARLRQEPATWRIGSGEWWRFYGQDIRRGAT